MKFKPTAEQELILANAEEGRNLAISAYAGTGKTATCKLIAKSLQKQSLYIAYNKSIAVEASLEFPIWVTCKTIHSIAYREIISGSLFQKKLKGFIDKKQITKLISGSHKQKYLNQIIENIEKYCNSDYERISDFCREILEIEDSKLIEHSLIVWSSMIDSKSETSITHDTYLKLFQLDKPNLGVEIIYLDECQDSNPVILDIVLRQDCQKILVGDKFQAIYGWRGAINAFDKLDESYSRLELTTSFRFNSEIAGQANKILELLGAESILKGKGETSEIKTKAFLVRSNLDLFSKLVEASQDNRYVHVIGGLKDLFSRLYSANNLRFDGDPARRYDKFIASFRSWDDFKEEGETNFEVSKILNIIYSYPALHQTIVEIKKILVEDPDQADIIFSTVHKSKGLEWDHIEITDQFFNFKAMEKVIERKITLVEFLDEGQTGNLLYVAITRARVRTYIPSHLLTFLETAKRLENDNAC